MTKYFSPEFKTEATKLSSENRRARCQNRRRFENQ